VGIRQVRNRINKRISLCIRICISIRISSRISKVEVGIKCAASGCYVYVEVPARFRAYKEALMCAYRGGLW